MTLPLKIALADARTALERPPKPYVELAQSGSLRFELYAPKGVDNQTPHSQDELYIITRGKGDFVRAQEREAFVTGDALFVPAGVEHRFVDFSDDFECWVVFWGPQGGESPGIVRQ